jgi:hypothetical protein
MSDSTRYTTLICSLPHHGPLFGARRPPLSRIRLNEFLSVLHEQDKADYETLSLLLDWSRHDRERHDADILRDAHKLTPTLVNRLAREMVQWRLGIRSVMAALRYRQRGEGTPPAGALWGYGRWMPVILRHWNEVNFRLERVYPWLQEARTLLESGAAVELERLLLGVVWRELERQSQGHEFDFEAVLIYCMRWEVVARWTRYHPDAAATRFEHLVREALSDVDLERIGK